MSPVSPDRPSKDRTENTIQFRPQRIKFADYKEIEMTPIPNFTSAKKSIQSFSIIRSFATNSSAGLIRNYNEDRVSIMINVPKDPNKIVSYWPSCSIFALYDGHGGSSCSDYLRDNLHNDITKSEYFPVNPRLALQDSIAKIEKQFCQYSLEGKFDHSGSCAIVALIVGIN
jgi:protein phosphatase 2C family protein 2/3